mmetsp:Transcript_41023/g.64765  ORF Transcript_41023/g.64765 Transcript_41023/m.64765 type:complete len:247 (-) Transcript_41023:24-764(-)
MDVTTQIEKDLVHHARPCPRQVSMDGRHHLFGAGQATCVSAGVAHGMADGSLAVAGNTQGPQGRLQGVAIHRSFPSFLAQLRQQLRHPGVAAVAAQHLAQGAHGGRGRRRRRGPGPGPLGPRCLAHSWAPSSLCGKVQLLQLLILYGAVQAPLQLGLQTHGQRQTLPGLLGQQPHLLRGVQPLGLQTRPKALSVCFLLSHGHAAVPQQSPQRRFLFRGRPRGRRVRRVRRPGPEVVQADSVHGASR